MPRFGDAGVDELPGVRDVLSHFDRCFVLRRGERDDIPCVHMEDQYTDRVKRYYTHEEKYLHPDMAPILKSIWPDILDEGKDWRYDWHSLPLHSADWSAPSRLAEKVIMERPGSLPLSIYAMPALP